MKNRELRRFDEPDVPSSTIGYFLREALRRIWSSKRTSFVAISMIAIALMILGAFMLIADNLEQGITSWQGRWRVNVYFDFQATPEQMTAVSAFLKSHPDLVRHRLVSREEALARFKSYFAHASDLVGELDSNPFPPSYEIDVTAPVVRSHAFDIEMAQLRAMAGVEQVQFDWEWLTRLRRLVGLINLAGLVTGGILAVAAAFTIANVIRLTMLMYREEIDIMRLVGATERIIRGPFLAEGILQGLIGGCLAAVLLFAGFSAAKQALPPSSSLVWGFLFTRFLPPEKLAALVFGGMFAGWLGSWLSVRERNEEK